MKQVSTLLLIIGLTFSLQATEYYVATDGSDAFPGTSVQFPFRTIQKASDVMQGGDRCLIRGGHYHEQIVIDRLHGTENDPIFFGAYGDEKVILDGTISISDLQTGPWSLHQGKIYKTALNLNVWQLFVDEDMMISARWPNARPDDGTFWNQDRFWAYGHDSDYDGFQMDTPHHDVDLRGFSESLVGAISILNVGNWKTWSRRITSHVPNSNSFKYDTIGGGYIENNLHRYFLECHLALLDAPEEWYYEPTSKTLYYWPMDGNSPENKNVRGKVQSYAFSLSDSSNIKISNLIFFATTFQIQNCTFIEVENCKFRYPSYSKRMLKDAGEPDATLVDTAGREDLSAVTIRNCTFSDTDGPAIYMRGLDNVIENCYFENIDYSVVNFRGVGFTFSTSQSPGITFRRNTVVTAGASSGFRGALPVINHYNLVEYNHFINCGLLQSDGANIQMGANTEHNSIVRYNWTHDTEKYGIRYDGKWELNRFSTNQLTHHNVCWNSGNAGFRIKGDAQKTYNNTGFSCAYEEMVIRGLTGGNTRSITRNNACEAISGAKDAPNEPIPGIHDHNWNAWLLGGVKIHTQLRDPDNLDFRPKPCSDLIDAGVNIPGVTENFKGDAPDIGAYEWNDSNYWIPGRKRQMASQPIPPHGSTNAKVNCDLMWLEGYQANAHAVYFGTDYEVVKNANREDLSFKGIQSNNIYNPGTLSPDTYYWRIDALSPSGITTGEVWSFTAAKNSGALELKFIPVDDAWVLAGSGANYGSASQLRVRSSSRYSYLKFVVDDLKGGQIESVYLHLHSEDEDIDNITIHKISDNSWEEETITGLNAPALEESLITQADILKDLWYLFDVSSYVKNVGTWSFALSTTHNVGGKDWYSKESSFPPELIVKVSGADDSDCIEPDFLMKLDASNDNPYEGETITYTVTISNNSTITLNNIAITNILPDGLSYVPGSISGGESRMVEGTKLTWNLGPLTSQSNVQLTYQVTVDAHTSGTSISNLANAYCPTCVVNKKNALRIIYVNHSFIKLKPKLMLQGALLGEENSVPLLMRDDLRSKKYLPAVEPYSALSSFTHRGGGGAETVSNTNIVFSDKGSDSIVDWVFIELRDADNMNVVYTRAGLVQRDGDVVDVDGTSPLTFSNAVPAFYYVSARHRNHLGLMIGNVVALSATPTAVDFTDPNQTYWDSGSLIYAGSSGVEFPKGRNVWALWGGNANADDSLIYTGENSDTGAIFNRVINDADNPNGEPEARIHNEYDVADTTMDGWIIYTSEENDTLIIFDNLLVFHKSNVVNKYFEFIIKEQLP